MYPTDPYNLLTVLREIYPPDKEALGVIAIQLRPRDEPRRRRSPDRLSGDRRVPQAEVVHRQLHGIL